jgi:hypothetical protein
LRIPWLRIGIFWNIPPSSPVLFSSLSPNFFF